jgi:hypothetical protein
VDKAANVGENVWQQEVIVDLEKPAATINGIRGGAPGSAPKEPEKTPGPEKEPGELP